MHSSGGGASSAAGWTLHAFSTPSYQGCGPYHLTNLGPRLHRPGWIVTGLSSVLANAAHGKVAVAELPSASRARMGRSAVSSTNHFTLRLEDRQSTVRVKHIFSLNLTYLRHEWQAIAAMRICPLWPSPPSVQGPVPSLDGTDMPVTAGFSALQHKVKESQTAPKAERCWLETRIGMRGDGWGRASTYFLEGAFLECGEPGVRRSRAPPEPHVPAGPHKLHTFVNAWSGL